MTLHSFASLCQKHSNSVFRRRCYTLSWRRRHRSMNSVLLGNLKLSLQSAALPAPQPAPPVQLALSPSDTREVNMKSLLLCPPSQLLELLWLGLRLKCLVSRSVGVWGCHSLERPQLRCTIGRCYRWIWTSWLVSSMKSTFFYCTKVRIIKQKPDDAAFPFSICYYTQYWFVLGIHYKVYTCITKSLHF